MIQMIMTGIPEYVKTFSDLSMVEKLVAALMGMAVAAMGVFFLYRHIKANKELLSEEHSGLIKEAKGLKRDLSDELGDLKEEHKDLSDEHEDLKTICNNIDKQVYTIYEFAKMQTHNMLKESQACKVNINLDNFIQSANAMANQNVSFTLEKQQLEAEKRDLENELAEAKEEIANLKKQVRKFKKDRDDKEDR